MDTFFLLSHFCSPGKTLFSASHSVFASLSPFSSLILFYYIYIRHLLLPQFFHTALLVFKHINPSLSTSVFFITIKLSPFSRSLHFSFFTFFFLFISSYVSSPFFSFPLPPTFLILTSKRKSSFTEFSFFILEKRRPLCMYLFLTCSANFNIVIYFTLLSSCAENVFQIEREEVFRGEGIGREGMAIQMDRSSFK